MDVRRAHPQRISAEGKCEVVRVRGIKAKGKVRGLVSIVLRL